MPYSIDKYSGSTVAVVEDGTINNTLDIKLIGKNYAGYGEAQNENFVWLLENFAGNTAPPRPTTGQLWYDNLSKRLKVFNGTTFKNTTGVEVGDTEPLPQVAGDFWFNTDTNQLFVWNGTTFDLVGPNLVPGYGDTAVQSIEVEDDTAAKHAIVQAIVNDEVVAIFSNDEFELNTPISGFTSVKKGITLKYTNQTTGVTANDFIFWGTSSDSLALGGRPYSDYVTNDGAVFSQVANFGDVGFILGDDLDVEVKIDSNGRPIVRNMLTDTILFQTTDETTYFTYTPLRLEGNKILPGSGEDSYEYDIGTDADRFRTMYAGTFDGLATQSGTLAVNGGIEGVNDFVDATVNAVAYKIAARDASGNLTANTFIGTSQQASALVIAGDTIPAADFVHVGSPVFTSTSIPVVFQDTGFKFGTTNKLTVNATVDTLRFNTATHTPLSIKGADILPGTDMTSSIGSSSVKYKEIHSGTFYGTLVGAVQGGVADNATNAVNAVNAEKSDTLLVPDNGNQYLPAALAADAYTIAVRGAGGIIQGELQGNAATASLADEADALKAVVDNGSGGQTYAYATASVEVVPNALVVRHDTGEIEGDILGNAATATLATTATNAISATSATTAGTVTTGAQPNITSLGTLTGITTAGSILPSTNGIANVGTSSYKFGGMYADAFYGDLVGNAQSASYASAAGGSGQADSLKVGSSYYSAAIDPSASTIAARDSSGNLQAALFIGTATAAQYADLAEKYLTDTTYEPGTVVAIGGAAEATACQEGDRAFGVVSTDPAFMMNKDLENGTYIALKGRVPCFVVGEVNKGDRLVAGPNGSAVVAPAGSPDVFGIAMESHTGDCPCKIEVIVL